MLERRLRALEQFQQMPMPTDWPGQPDLSEVDLNEIVPYIRPDIETRGGAENWEDLPEEIQDTFDKLGILEAEKNAPSGVGAQYESEIVYQNMQERWEEKGVIFMDMDKAVREHPDLVKEHFMTKCVPRATTSSRRSTAPSGPAARSSTSPRTRRSTCRSRRTSA